MKNRVNNLLMLAAIAGSLTLASCRETKEDDSSHMQNEMQDGEHMEDNNMMDDGMMDDNNMDEDHMEEEGESTSDKN